MLRYNLVALVFLDELSANKSDKPSVFRENSVFRNFVILSTRIMIEGGFMKLHQMYNPITATPYLCDKTYMEVAPCQELAPYIKCFWGSRAPYEENQIGGMKSNFIIPDTCMDIIFDINYTDNEINNHFSGINDRPFELNRNNNGKTLSTFAIRFYPWSVYLFSEDSLIDIKNQSLDLEYHFSELKREMEPMLFCIQNMKQRIALAEKYLLKKLHLDRMNDYVMNAMCKIIKYKGNLDISVLANNLHISMRQLERVFAVNIGISPKKLTSLVKYQFLWRDILVNKKYNILDAVYIKHTYYMNLKDIIH